MGIVAGLDGETEVQKMGSKNFHSKNFPSSHSFLDDETRHNTASHVCLSQYTYDGRCPLYVFAWTCLSLF
jgi:hypothetical protein